LLQTATLVACNLADNLLPVNKLPVQVYRVPSHVLRSIADTNADGCAMNYEGRYAIFLSDPPNAAPERLPSLTGHWLSRFYLLHEYAHIRNGDVFEDHPEATYNLMMRDREGDSQANQTLWQREQRADGYAAHRVMQEAEAVGNTVLHQELQDEIESRGLPQS
jgi:hypothetical protein